MEFINISDIKPHDNGEPIHIRVIKKWTPHGKKKQFCYLFVDEKGDAIEAVAELNYKAHFESIVCLQNCYKVTDYLSDTARPYMNVVPHEACVKLGLTSCFLPLNSTNIPKQVFNFVKYETLKARLNNHSLLSDFVGRMLKMSNVFNRGGVNMMKITMQDESAQVIEVTLWEEIAKSVDRNKAVRGSQVVIIALTSMKVTEYKGAIQLESTNATSVIINPDIDDLDDIKIRFRSIPSTSSSVMANDDIKKMLSIDELMHEYPKDNFKNTFSCQAHITEIDNARKWYYKSCDKCRKKVLPKEDKFACPDHGEIQTPRYMYAVNASLGDNTSMIAVVLFNDVMTKLVGMDCSELVKSESFPSPIILPKSLRAVVGKEKTYHLRFREKDMKNKVVFTVTDVIDYKGKQCQLDCSSSSNTTKVKKRRTK